MSAPVSTEGKHAGIAVDPRWESEHGHAHAAVRYGAMSWQSSSREPTTEEQNPRKLAILRMRDRLRQKNQPGFGDGWEALY